MLHTLCDKFDKIYGIIYTKNTSSDRGNLKTSKVCRLKPGRLAWANRLFFANFAKKNLTSSFLSLEF